MQRWRDRQREIKRKIDRQKWREIEMEETEMDGETEAGVGEANVAKVLTGNPGSPGVRVGGGVAVPGLLCLLRTSQNKPEKQTPLLISG